MKALLTLLLLSSLLTARTLEELKADWKKAYETQDFELLWSLTHFDDVESEEYSKAKTLTKKYFERKFTYAKEHKSGVILFEEVQETPLADHMSEFRVRNGIRYDFVSKPLGCLVLNYSYGNDNKSTGGSVKPFGKIDGKYVFLGQKHTKLDWDGPNDRKISLRTQLKSDKPSNVVLSVTRNASGVTITETITLSSELGGNRSTFFYGQHVETITILEADPFDSLELEIFAKEAEEMGLVFEHSFTHEDTLLYKKL